MAKRKKEKPFMGKPPKFKVGDWVEFYYMFGKPGSFGQIIEDRGPLGQDGEHLYVLRRTWEWGESENITQAESDLRPAKAPTVSK